METTVKNVFKVGPQVSGASFIGREDWVNRLTEDLFDSSCSISLVGPTRIGKSSLVNQVLLRNAGRENRLVLRLCMAEYESANMFWMELMDRLREAVEDADHWDDKLEKYYTELESLSVHDDMWGTLLRRIMRRVFKHVGKQGFRVVVVIDEFDGVVNVFGNNVAEYQLLRSLYSEPTTYYSNGIIISRRTLKFMEQKVTSLSTLHGVFTRETLDGFNDADMAAYYRVLEDSGVSMTEDGKDQLMYYTGGIPYLCSMFGQRLVAGLPQTRQTDSMTVVGVYKERKASIVEYYDDLIDRLDGDKHLEPLLYLSLLGSLRSQVDGTDLETMHSLGVLRKDDCYGYYAYSADFMKYLQTKPLNVPYWQLLVGAEACLKRLLARVYPELEQTTYQDLRGAGGLLVKSELSQKYPGLNLQWPVLEQTFASLAGHKSRPTVLDALTLVDVISGVLEDWDKSFCHHFGGDTAWAGKLRLIRKLYNPLASANGQYITKPDLAICSQYCQELIHLNF